MKRRRYTKHRLRLLIASIEKDAQFVWNNENWFPEVVHEILRKAELITQFALEMSNMETEGNDSKTETILS